MALAALLLPLLLIYGPALNFPFLVFGDAAAVYQNPFTEWWPHPVATASHWFDAKILGAAPLAHHAVSILLHGVNTVLLFLLMRRLLGQWMPAALVTGLWALHPARAEAVSWVASRGILLVGLFVLLAAWFWEKKSSWRYGRYGLLALAVLADPAEQILPFTAQKFTDALAAPLRALITLPPWQLSIVYPPAPVWMAAGSVVLAVAVGWWLWRGNREAFWGWAIFVACGWASMLDGGSASLRWTYPGHMGLFYALVRFSLPWLMQRAWVHQAAVVVCVIWAGCSWVRSADFRDTFAIAEATRQVAPDHEGILFTLAQTHFELAQYPQAEGLYRRLTQVAPANATYWVGLGNALQGQKNRMEALTAFEEAVKRDPKAANAHYGVGITRTELGGLEPAALSSFQKALELGLEGRPAAIAASNLGTYLASQKKPAAALPWFEKSIAYDPKFAQGHVNYGLALAETGQRELAILHLQHKALLWTNGDQSVGNLYTSLVNQTSMEEYAKAKEEQAREDAERKKVGKDAERKKVGKDAERKKAGPK
jgi:tetratricopeptide (TPR) repeat protein